MFTQYISYQVEGQVRNLGRERQIRKQEEIRKTILDIARDIIAKEGIQGLSIRKITNAIDYSPAIIYHYFKDKNEIVKALVSEGHERILAAAGSVARNEKEPEKEIQEAFTNYIKAALASPEEYMAFLLNSDASVLEKTSLLKKGVSRTSTTLQMLRENLERGINQGRYSAMDTELTAQILWTSTFGLIVKLITETGLPQEQVERLIKHHFIVLFNGILKEV